MTMATTIGWKVGGAQPRGGAAAAITIINYGQVMVVVVQSIVNTYRCWCCWCCCCLLVCVVVCSVCRWLVVAVCFWCLKFSNGQNTLTTVVTRGVIALMDKYHL